MFAYTKTRKKEMLWSYAVVFWQNIEGMHRGWLILQDWWGKVCENAHTQLLSVFICEFAISQDWWI